MPSIEAAAMSTVTAEWLLDKLRDSVRISPPLLLDCRPSNEFYGGHIQHAINVTLPTLMLRRLAADKLKVAELIKASESRQRFADHWQTHTVVLCGGGNLEHQDDDNQQPVLATLYRKLRQDGAHVLFLEGGFANFRSKYPEWCVCDAHLTFDPEAPILGLQSLCIASSPSSLSSGSSSSSEGDCSSSEKEDDDERFDSCLGRETPSFPVQILPFLFLGNAENSADLDALRRHNISHILNVTPDLPNIFQNEGGIKYLQIPINDHWSQDLATFFPESIAFIEEARKNQSGVLVHCLAGISRSVTITVAYLMCQFQMPLNKAYDYVKKRKANISPNINFMGQLLEFEKQLRLTDDSPCPSASALLSAPLSATMMTLPSPTPTNRTTPDSGIDFESWV